MRNVLLITLLALISTPLVEAGNDLLPGVVQDALQHYFDGEWGPGNTTYESASRPRSLKIPEDATVRVDGERHPRGIVIVHVEIDVPGRRLRRVPLSLRVMPIATVPVAVRDLKRGSTIGVGDVRWEKRRITDVRDDWPQDSGDLVSGKWWARRMVRSGDVVTDNTIELKPDVLSGERVTMIARQGDVLVETTGIAMENGYAGDLIRVEYPQYRKILRARVTQFATVEVEGLERRRTR